MEIQNEIGEDINHFLAEFESHQYEIQAEVCFFIMSH